MFPETDTASLSHQQRRMARPADLDKYIGSIRYKCDLFGTSSHPVR